VVQHYPVFIDGPLLLVAILNAITPKPRRPHPMHELRHISAMRGPMHEATNSATFSPRTHTITLRLSSMEDTKPGALFHCIGRAKCEAMNLRNNSLQ
jgi:hypothetical protein